MDFLDTCKEAIEAFDQMDVELERIKHKLNWIEQELDRMDGLV